MMTERQAYMMTGRWRGMVKETRKGMMRERRTGMMEGRQKRTDRGKIGEEGLNRMEMFSLTCESFSRV